MKKVLNILKGSLKERWDKLNRKEISNLILVINPIVVLLLKETLNTLGLIIIVVCLLTIAIFFHIFSMLDKKENGLPIPNKNYVKKQGNKLTVDECDIYPLIVYFNDLYEYLEKEGLL